MNGFSIGKVVLAIAAIALCCQLATAAPRVKREDAADNDEFVLSPVGAVETAHNEVSRDKRKITEAFGSKNAILGYVFGGSSAPLVTTKAPPVTTTTDDTPDFDRTKVSLDIPDRLFSTSFSTVTNVSKIFGDFLMNSAKRYAQFVQYFKPALGKALTVKGFDVRPTVKTTTEAFDFDAE